MNAIRQWMSRRSGPELFFINGIYFGLFMWLISPLIGQPWSVLTASIGGALFGLLATIVTLRSRRRLGGSALGSEISSAIKSGALPDLIVPTVWLTQLDLRLASARRERISTPVTVGVVALCETASAFFSPRINYGFLVLAGLIVSAGVFAIVSNRGVVPRIEALEQKVRDAYNVPTPEPIQSAG